MFNDMRIYVIVGMFMTAGIALMLFNYIIIRYSKGQNSSVAGRTKKWKKILYRQTGIAGGKKQSNFKHEKLLEKHLSNIENLVAYSNALQYIKSEFPVVYSGYIGSVYTVFHNLAIVYGRKPSIERACFADFVCNFPEVSAQGDTFSPLTEALISFADDPNIHCRTNALRALCGIGNAQAVANALQVINDKQMFIHSQTLTVELSNFKGNREALADYLWNKSENWNDNIKVAVIGFITGFSKHYKEAFLPVLRDNTTSAGVRIAIIRYFGKYIYNPVRLVLIDMIKNVTDINLAIVAATALEFYPAADTITTLQSALSNQNWHVRYNAASSIVNIGDRRSLREIMRSNDNREKEIVTYMLEREGVQEGNDNLVAVAIVKTNKDKISA